MLAPHAQRFTLGHGGSPKHPTVSPQAKEFGEAEVWMNERLSRHAPGACAEFITAFKDKGAGAWLPNSGRGGGGMGWRLPP